MNLDGLFEHFTEGEPTQGAIFFLIGLVAVLAFFVITSAFKKYVKDPSSVGAKNLDDDDPEKPSQRQFSAFAFKLLARKCGLNSEQTKMLDYALKADGVKDPVKSIGSSELLDKHFKKAFRLIQKNTENDEEMQKKFDVLFATRSMLESSVEDLDITSSREVSENVNVFINIENDRYSTNLISAKGETFDVACPTTASGEAVKLAKGTKLEVFMLTRSGRSNLTFKSRVAGLVEQQRGAAKLKLEHSEDIKYIFQRKNRRKEAGLQCGVFLVSNVGKRLVVDKKRINGTIADISAGGCAIKTSAAISPGTKLKIEFTEGKGANVAVLGEVLRSDKSVLSIKFLKLARKSLNIINAFVYDFNQ